MALGRWMRRGGLGIAAVLAVWGVLWLVAYTMTDRSGWARETDTIAFLVLRDDVLLYEGCRDTGTDPAERYQYL